MLGTRDLGRMQAAIDMDERLSLAGELCQVPGVFVERRGVRRLLDLSCLGAAADYLDDYFESDLLKG